MPTCPPNFNSINNNDSVSGYSCEECTQCPIGQFKNACTDSSDGGSCSPCTNNLSPREIYTQVNSCNTSTCSPGQIPKFDSAQNQNPTRCVDCSEGTYEVDGTCMDCPVNKYNLNKGQTSCLDCNTCSPGEKNYECGGANIGQCSPCTGTLTSNQIYKPFGELSNKHDTCLTNTCSPCSQPNSSQLECNTCSPGTYSENGSECISCQTNTYQDEAGQNSCKVCPTCSPGFENINCSGENSGTWNPCTNTLKKNEIFFKSMSTSQICSPNEYKVSHKIKICIEYHLSHQTDLMKIIVVY